MALSRRLRPIWCSSMGLWIRCPDASDCPHARRLVEVELMVERPNGCARKAQVSA